LCVVFRAEAALMQVRAPAFPGQWPAFPAEVPGFRGRLFGKIKLAQEFLESRIGAKVVVAWIDAEIL
jgi:hypothetical protein